ncbi:MAG: hypothetical protein GX876_03125 [Bacteroidales bacterium]|nr:hypothetical protein [Bacteroidales bacterium]
MKKPALIILSAVLGILINIFPSDAQMLHDSATVRKIKTGVDYMYNMEFDKASRLFSEIEKLYPGHPVNLLLKGIFSYWKDYPMLPASESRVVFENNLRTCMDLCSDGQYQKSYEAESLLANICSRGLLLLYYNENDLSFKVITLATSTFKYILKAFDHVSAFADFYYPSGLYNYYREAYPHINPVYKPLASLFPPGDMKKGLIELARAAELSIFLKAESYSVLAYIYAGFENDFRKALLYSGILTKKYPLNPYYKALHMRNLLFKKEYDLVESMINLAGNDTGNAYFDAQLLIFNGIIQEKKYKNYPDARQLYEDGISAIAFTGDYGNEYCGYAYLGLSRICEHDGDRAGKKAFHRKGYGLLNFKKITFD